MKPPVVIATVVFLSFSCAHVQQAAETCARQVTPDLVKTVATDLAADNYDDALKALESSVSLCVLKVAVQDAENAATADSSALSAHDPRTTAIVAHAQAWLGAHDGPAVVKAGLPGGPGHGCRWKAGSWSTVVNPPNCPAPSISLTPDNLSSRCSCAPIQLWF